MSRINHLILVVLIVVLCTACGKGGPKNKEDGEEDLTTEENLIEDQNPENPLLLPDGTGEDADGDGVPDGEVGAGKVKTPTLNTTRQGLGTIEMLEWRTRKDIGFKLDHYEGEVKEWVAEVKQPNTNGAEFNPETTFHDYSPDKKQVKLDIRAIREGEHVITVKAKALDDSVIAERDIPVKVGPNPVILQPIAERNYAIIDGDLPDEVVDLQISGGSGEYEVTESCLKVIGEGDNPCADEFTLEITEQPIEEGQPEKVNLGITAHHVGHYKIKIEVTDTNLTWRSAEPQEFAINVSQNFAVNAYIVLEDGTGGGVVNREKQTLERPQDIAIVVTARQEEAFQCEFEGSVAQEIEKKGDGGAAGPQEFSLEGNEYFACLVGLQDGTGLEQTREGSSFGSVTMVVSGSFSDGGVEDTEDKVSITELLYKEPPCDLDLKIKNTDSNVEDHATAEIIKLIDLTESYRAGGPKHDIKEYNFVINDGEGPFVWTITSCIEKTKPGDFNGESCGEIPNSPPKVKDDDDEKTIDSRGRWVASCVETYPEMNGGCEGLKLGGNSMYLAGELPFGDLKKIAHRDINNHSQDEFTFTERLTIEVKDQGCNDREKGQFDFDSEIRFPPPKDDHLVEVRGWYEGWYVGDTEMTIKLLDTSGSNLAKWKGSPSDDDKDDWLVFRFDNKAFSDRPTLGSLRELRFFLDDDDWAWKDMCIDWGATYFNAGFWETSGCEPGDSWAVDSCPPGDTGRDEKFDYGDDGDEDTLGGYNDHWEVDDNDETEHIYLTDFVWRVRDPL